MNINRILLFLIGCIGSRLLLVYIAKNNVEYLPLMGLFALMASIGFMYIYLTDSRQTGPEVFGEKIWWNKLRPIHAMILAIFAYHAFKKEPYSWKFLLIDVLFGLTSFIIYHLFLED
jgi:hypothetical protein